jgi:hypothetical protein
MTSKHLPTYLDHAIYQFLLDVTGLPRHTLHMIIYGFVLEEGTKPIHEHHLQVWPARASLVLFHLSGLRKSYAT